MFHRQKCHNLKVGAACIAKKNMVGDWNFGPRVMGKSSMAGRYPVFLGSGCMNIKYLEKASTREKKEQQRKDGVKPKMKTHWNEDESPKCIIEFGEWVDQLVEEVEGQAESSKEGEEAARMGTAGEASGWKWNELVRGPVVKLSGLIGRWKKKIVWKMKAVKGRIDTAQQQIRFGHLKEVVREQETKLGIGDWWGIQKGKCQSRMVCVGNQAVLGLLTLSAMLLGVEQDQQVAAKEKLHAKQQHVGRSGQLLESTGASELDRLSREMTQFYRGRQPQGKKLLTRSKLRRARKVVRQYEKMARAPLKCSFSLEKQSLVVNGERTECCNFVSWYERHHGSAEEASSESKLGTQIASLGKKIWCLAKGSVLLVAGMATRVADCCRWAMMAVGRLGLAGIGDDPGGRKEIFVQIGFECMVVPVKNDMSDPVQELYQQVGKHLQGPAGKFSIELRWERPDKWHSAVQRSGATVHTVCSGRSSWRIPLSW